MSRAKSLLLVSVLTLVVAACGGGGDSGPDTNQADITPPTTPVGLVATAAGGAVVNLTWSASTDNVAVTAYVVKRNGVQIGTPTTPGYSDTGLAPATTYSYTVAAQDAAGNISPDPASVSATTDDTIAPTAPTGLVATAAGGSVVNLAWSASTDNVAVTGYIVRRNGVQLHRGRAGCGGQHLVGVDNCERHDGRHDRAHDACRSGGDSGRCHGGQPDVECVRRQRRGDWVYRQTQWRAGGHADCHELCGYGAIVRNHVQLHRGGARCGEPHLARIGDR